MTRPTLGPFTLLDQLGKGGMGVVWLAEDTRLGRLVALKVLRPELAADATRRLRFLREARTAAALVHPRIATVFEVGEAAGELFIAMELVEGRSLRDAIDGALRDGALGDGGALSAADALPIARDIAEALSAAHAASVVHRDLKPDNVVLTHDGRAKLLDFGIAKALSPVDAVAASGLTPSGGTLTREGSILGTPGYMSPEQARGLAADARSDVFSFGVLLYELLTGRPPFQGPTPLDVLTSVVRDAPPPPARLAPATPAWLDALVIRCLDKDAAGRPQSGAALVALLDDAGRGQLPDHLLPATRPLRPYATGDDLALADTLDGARGPQAPDGADHGDDADPDLVPPGRPGWLLPALALGLLAAGLLLWATTGPPPDPPTATLDVAPTLRAPRSLRLERVTSDGGKRPVTAAALAPSGTFLAYADADGLQVVSLGSGNRRALPLPAGSRVDALRWFPDGERLALLRSTPDSPAPPQVEIHTLLGDRARALDLTARALAVSPDGTQLALLTERGLVVVPAQGPTAEALPDPLLPAAGLHAFAFSPDGARLAVLRDGDLGPVVATLPATGGPQREVATLPGLGGGAALAWLPDGRLVWAQPGGPDGSPGAALWAARVAETGASEGPPALLAEWPTHQAAELTADARGRVAVLRRRTRRALDVRELDRGGLALGPPRGRAASAADVARVSAWSPDGAEVWLDVQREDAWVSTAQALPRDADGVAPGLSNATGAVPTPDGAARLYWATDPPGPHATSTARLMRQPLGGGPAAVLLEVRDARPDAARPPPTLHDVRCARGEGRPCVLRELDAAEARWQRFSLLDPDRGTLVPLTTLDHATPRPAPGWDLSIDGTQIVSVDPAGGLDLFGVADPHPRRLTLQADGAPCRPRDVAWLASGAAVLVTCARGETASDLAHIDASGHVTALTSRPEALVASPRLSPDGRGVAFALTTTAADVWTLDGL